MPVVHAEGRIGQIRLDVTTEREVRAKLGKPAKFVAKMDPAVAAPKGERTLFCRCGPQCQTAYVGHDAPVPAA
jgi:hypothetical protein